MNTITKWTLISAVLILFTGTISRAAEKQDPRSVFKASKEIDAGIQQRLVDNKLTPSPITDDAEFLRRVYLDITGVIPTAEKAAQFLDSKDSEKRAKLIDELLSSSDFGRHQADIWTDMLFPRNSDNRRLQNTPLFGWLETQFNNNRPWNELVFDLITASGEQDKNGAITFYLANPTVDKMTDTVSKLFMGVQLQCAQCHDHPFTKWKQTEYWGMAAFFFKVRPDKPKGANKGETVLGVTEIAKPQTGKNQLPESAKIVPPKFPLGGETPKVKDAEPFRPVLAKWMTDKNNPYFAKAMANRLWGQFFGRGFVNPIDDMHEGNTPSHPEVLDALAKEFTNSGFDLKHLVRVICNSRTYQRGSKTNENNEADTTYFSHAAVKPLTAEQLYDSLSLVIGKQNRPDSREKNGVKGGGAPFSRVTFVNFFRGDENADPTEYQAGIPQVLRLMNSEVMNRGGELLTQAAKSGDPAKLIETLYLGTYSRRPTEKESKRMQEYLAKHDKKTGSLDLFWVLLNSSEFALSR